LKKSKNFEQGTALQNSGWQTGQPVRLFSCGAGNPALGANAPAQQLANILGVEVQAPTEAIHLFKNGEFVINDVNKAYQGVSKSTGTWLTFRPQ
jgi:hypothetical protein